MSPKCTRFIRFPAVMTVIMLPCCLATRCGGNQPIPPPTTPQRTYTTDFPLTENPISEGGNWVSGSAVGESDVQTTGGFAGGVGPAVSSDPVAILTGTWGPNQTVQATVYSVGASGSHYQEVELHVHMTFVGTRNVTGYEINFRTPNNSSAYVGIVRWNGSLGDWTGFTPVCSYPVVGAGCGEVTGLGVSNGDVLKATISGSTISAYINNVLIVQVTDDTFSTGNPGMGFNYGCDGTYSTFGFTQYSATDGPTTVPAGQ